MDRQWFRGKRIDNGEWVYGGVYPDGDIAAIITPEVYGDTGIIDEVAPDTLGQCTGLSAAKSYRGDRPEDLLIFEGDVVRKSLGKGRHYDTAIVWIAAGFERHGIHGYHPIHGSELEIIGNVHDNTELMEAQP